MPGDYWRQFAGMRALAFYQMTHPGGKLNFMGNEIAQFIEWRYYEGIQYFMAEQFEAHRRQPRLHTRPQPASTWSSRRSGRAAYCARWLRVDRRQQRLAVGAELCAPRRRPGR
jgi:1,4-alpha-glucan branching enzyme